MRFSTWVGRMFTALTILAVAVSAAAPASAQTSQSEIRGTVVDQSGAALPGVTVTATHVDTGAARTTVTSETGVFLMPALPVGLYRVQLELAGFTNVVRDNLRLAVGQSAVLSFAMALATVEETVTVSGDAPLVETQKSDLAGRVTAGQVAGSAAQRPQLARSRGARARRARQPRNGARGVRGRRHGEIPGRRRRRERHVLRRLEPGLQPGEHPGVRGDHQSLRRGVRPRRGCRDQRRHEVRAPISCADPAFSFIRDSDLGDARNFFTNTVQPFHEKQSGVNGGGPIKRDRAFFFASYEYQSRTVTAIPKTGFAAIDVAAPNDITRHYTSGRVDMQLAQRHRLFVRSSKYDWEQINVGVGERNGLSNGYSRPSKNTDLSVGETWVMNDRLVHEVRAGFSTIDNQLVSNSTLPLHTFPSIIIGSPTNSPQWWKEFNVQVNNSLSYFVPVVARRAQLEDRRAVLPAALRRRVPERRAVGRVVHVLHRSA